jgi:ribosomal protein S18 acetylase RimI-like enzyme
VSVELVPASRLTPGQLAALFTDSFYGYAVPMQIDEAGFRLMADLFDVDVDASRVAVCDGRPIGLVNLGVRGRAGWIAGLGVVSDERRRGVGESLMRGVHESARALGVEEVWLEVFELNAPAVALYEKLAYERVRELDVWSLESGPLEPAAGALSAAAAHARVRELRLAPEPWQRADAVLERMLETEPVEGLETAGGAAVVRVTGQTAVVEQIAARTTGAARELLAGALRLGSPVRLTNVPTEDPVSEAFRELGGRLELRQRELRLAL